MADLDTGQTLPPLDDARAAAQGASATGPRGGPLIPARALPQQPAPRRISLPPLRKVDRSAGRRSRRETEEGKNRRSAARPLTSVTAFRTCGFTTRLFGHTAQLGSLCIISMAWLGPADPRRRVTGV